MPAAGGWRCFKTLISLSRETSVCVRETETYYATTTLEKEISIHVIIQEAGALITTMTPTTRTITPTTKGCPCKGLSYSLSSFTAAEYGILLRRTANKNKKNTITTIESCHGYNLLHFTAQHGHVASTAYLLQCGANPQVGSCGATPLHRASYSGSIGTMKLLLDAQPSSSLSLLLAQDTSFSSNETPLHKASSAGRYLAVQLLLFYLIKAASTTTQHLDTNNDLRPLPSILQQALQAKDSSGRTPLDVAQQQQQNIINENDHNDAYSDISTSRWDTVAGSQANWQLCAQLLQMAESNDYNYIIKKLGSPDNNGNDDPSIQKLYTECISIKEIPSFSCHYDNDTIPQDCNTNDTSNTDPCKIESWEHLYFEALKDNLQDSIRFLLNTNTTVTTSAKIISVLDDIKNNNRPSASTRATKSFNDDSYKSSSMGPTAPSSAKNLVSRLTTTPSNFNGASRNSGNNSINKINHSTTTTSSNDQYCCFGCSCNACGKTSLTLYRGTSKKHLLYCRKCSRYN